MNNNNFLQGIAGYNDIDVSEPVIVNKPADLPPGAYVLRIIDAKVERYSTSKIAIKLAYDIAEGPAAGYYESLYKYNKTGKYGDTAKWKGTFSIWYPVADESEENRKRTIIALKRSITAINNSNPGAKIDPALGINLDDFKGKIVGGAFGLVDGEYNGRQWTKCECRWLVSVDKVRSGAVETPGHKYLNEKHDNVTTETSNNAPAQQSAQAGNTTWAGNTTGSGNTTWAGNTTWSGNNAPAQQSAQQSAQWPSQQYAQQPTQAVNQQQTQQSDSDSDGITLNDISEAELTDW